MWFSFENGCYFTQKRTPADQVVLRPFQILLVLKALALITKCHRRGEGWVSMLRCLNRAKGTLESSGRSAVLKRVATGAAAAVQVIAGAQYGTITWCILAPVVLSAMLTCWWHRGRNLAARSYGLLEIFHFTPIHIIIFFFGAVQVASCQILAFVLCLKLYLSFDKMIAKNDFIQFASCRPSKTQHINKLRLSERNACHCSPLLGLSFPANLSYSFPFLHKLFLRKVRWPVERWKRKQTFIAMLQVTATTPQKLSALKAFWKDKWGECRASSWRRSGKSHWRSRGRNRGREDNLTATCKTWHCWNGSLRLLRLATSYLG